jgi:adenylate cyclase class IV
MGLFDALLPKPRGKTHTLKWPLQELRYTAPVDDAEALVAKIKKEKAVFVSGGEFADVVHAKAYGSAFAYFIVRTEKKTQKEFVLFDGYMLQEGDRLGSEITASSYITRDLEELGYQQALVRGVTEWRFLLGVLRVAVYDVDGFGALLEVALPEAKTDKAREIQDKACKTLFKRLAIKIEEAAPTDAITLQLVSQANEPQA